MAEEARQYHLKISGAPERQNITIYNGIDLTRFAHLDGARDALRRELGIPSDAEVLTTLAVLREPKGIQFMIQAMLSLLRRFPVIGADGNLAGREGARLRAGGLPRPGAVAGRRTPGGAPADRHRWAERRCIRMILIE